VTRVLIIQHADFEGPGAIADWAVARGHNVATTMAARGEFPLAHEDDLLVILGGPMSAGDEALHPWLAAEKLAIRSAVDAGASALGVCLGAQILAGVLGASVGRNPEPEIGWFPIDLTPAARTSPAFGAFPESPVVGHWHGDTFGLPPGATRIATSEACANQGFECSDGRVVGVQFHLEWTAESVDALLGTCASDLVPGPHVVTAEGFSAGEREYGQECRRLLYAVLDGMAILG